MGLVGPDRSGRPAHPDPVSPPTRRLLPFFRSERDPRGVPCGRCTHFENRRVPVTHCRGRSSRMWTAVRHRFRAFVAGPSSRRRPEHTAPSSFEAVTEQFGIPTNRRSRVRGERLRRGINPNTRYRPRSSAPDAKRRADDRDLPPPARARGPFHRRGGQDLAGQVRDNVPHDERLPPVPHPGGAGGTGGCLAGRWQPIRQRDRGVAAAVRRQDDPDLQPPLRQCPHQPAQPQRPRDNRKARSVRAPKPCRLATTAVLDQRRQPPRRRPSNMANRVQRHLQHQQRAHSRCMHGSARRIRQQAPHPYPRKRQA